MARNSTSNRNPFECIIRLDYVSKRQHPAEIAFNEMERDVDRLTSITERFSKIGSQPEMTDQDLSETLVHALDYMMNRLGKSIELFF